MSTLIEIEAAAEALPPEEQAKLLEFLTVRLRSQLHSVPLAVDPTRRQPGLHAGAWDVAADFDAPLPDDFWLGRDA